MATKKQSINHYITNDKVDLSDTIIQLGQTDNFSTEYNGKYYLISLGKRTGEYYDLDKLWGPLDAVYTITGNRYVIFEGDRLSFIDLAKKSRLIDISFPCIPRHPKQIWGNGYRNGITFVIERLKPSEIKNFNKSKFFSRVFFHALEYIDADWESENEMIVDKLLDFGMPPGSEYECIRGAFGEFENDI